MLTWPFVLLGAVKALFRFTSRCRTVFFYRAWFKTRPAVQVWHLRKVNRRWRSLFLDSLISRNPLRVGRGVSTILRNWSKSVKEPTGMSFLQILNPKIKFLYLVFVWFKSNCFNVMFFRINENEFVFVLGAYNRPM